MSFLKNDHLSHFYVRNSIAHVTVSINTSDTLALEVIVCWRSFLSI